MSFFSSLLLLAALIVHNASGCSPPQSAGVDQTCGFETHTWDAVGGEICEGGSLKTGDFNGDGKADIICLYLLAGAMDYEVYLSRESSTYEGIDFTISAWCDLTTDAIFIGDFNGDHRDDVMCHEADGDITVVFNEVGPYFGETIISDPIDYNPLPACVTTLYTVYVGDFDGDRISDVLCHNTADGHVFVTFGRHNVGSLRRRRHVYPYFFHYGTVTPHTHATFPGRASLMPHHLCFAANDKILIGDVDRNGKDDFVCYNYGTGAITVSYLDYNGHLESADALTHAGLCLDGTKATLIQADNNHRADLFCESAASTPEVYLYIFASTGSDPACEGIVPSPVCADSRLFADVNGDGRDDMICYDTTATSSMKIYYNECD